MAKKNNYTPGQSGWSNSEADAWEDTWSSEKESGFGGIKEGHQDKYAHLDNKTEENKKTEEKHHKKEEAPAQPDTSFAQNSWYYNSLDNFTGVEMDDNSGFGGDFDLNYGDSMYLDQLTEAAKKENASKVEAEEKAAEAEESFKEAEAKAEEEAKAKAEAEAKAKAEEEEKAKAEEEAKVKAEERAKAEEEAKAKEEERAKAEEEAKAKEEERAKAEEEANAKAEERAKAEEEAKARAEERAKAEEEAKALEEARLKAEEEAKAREEERAKAEEEAKTKAEEEAKARAEEEAREAAEAEERKKAREEAEAKEAAAAAEAEAKLAEARKLAEERKAKAEAALKAQEEAKRKVAEEEERTNGARVNYSIDANKGNRQSTNDMIADVFSVDMKKDNSTTETRKAAKKKRMDALFDDGKTQEQLEREARRAAKRKAQQEELDLSTVFSDEPEKPEEPVVDDTPLFVDDEALEEAKKQAEEADRLEAESRRELEEAEAAIRAAEELKKKLEEERQARIEAEQKAEEERRALEVARAKAEEERKAREEAERKAEEERKAAEEAARKAAEEQARKAAEEAARKAEEERKAAEEAARKAEEERKAREEAERKAEEERKAREEAEARAEAERKAREEAERKAEEERKAAEEAARKAEEERKAAEEAARKAAEEAERKAREEAERKAREEAEAKAEAERKAAEEAARKAEEERKAAEDKELNDLLGDVFSTKKGAVDNNVRGKSNRRKAEGSGEISAEESRLEKALADLDADQEAIRKADEEKAAADQKAAEEAAAKAALMAEEAKRAEEESIARRAAEKKAAEEAHQAEELKKAEEARKAEMAKREEERLEQERASEAANKRREEQPELRAKMAAPPVRNFEKVEAEKEEEQELISVIVPIYNVEKYLDKCIWSIVNQTYENLEIILIDDGSTDHCREICEEWEQKDSRIKFVHKENTGVSDTRNVGLRIATGKLIGFVDSDDYIGPRMYEALHWALKKDNADMSACQELAFIERGDPKYEPSVDLADKSYEGKYKLEDHATYITHFLDAFTGQLTWTWNKLFKKELIENISFPVGKVLEDVMFTADYAPNVQRCAWILEKMYFYRQREDSIMNSGKAELFSEYRDAILHEYWALKDTEDTRFNEAHLRKVLSTLINRSSKAMDAGYHVMSEDLKASFDQLYDEESKLIKNEKTKYMFMRRFGVMYNTVHKDK